MKKALLLVIGGMFLGKYALFDDIIDNFIDSILPTQNMILIVSIIMISIGLYYINKEGHLKMPKFLK